MASAACTAAAGIGVSLTFIFKSCDNGSSTLPESSSVSIEENSSVDSVTDNSVDTANKENVDIFKSHNYPELADEDMITLSQLAENKEKYEDNIMSEDYENLVFTVRPDIFVPDEIGRYQIQRIDKYLENAEEVIKFLVGEAFDESCIKDYRKLDDPIYTPYSINYKDGEHNEEGVQTSGVSIFVGNNGAISYVDDQKNIDLYAYDLSDVMEEKTYFLQADYTDETYSFGKNDMSISQFAKTVDDSLDNMLSLLGYKGNVGQLAIIAEKDKSGTVMLTSKFANIYKSLPICNSLPSSDSAESECILNVSDYGIVPTQYALTTNGQTIQYIYIHSQFTDYKTIEEYDKIVAPDKAAKLLSEHLAPNLQDNEIVGMGLSYYPYYVGDIQAEPRIEGADPETTQVYELTPFRTFYFYLDPSVIGLVDCKTGEVAYIHNTA